MPPPGPLRKPPPPDRLDDPAPAPPPGPPDHHGSHPPPPTTTSRTTGALARPQPACLASGMLGRGPPPSEAGPGGGHRRRVGPLGAGPGARRARAGAPGTPNGLAPLRGGRAAPDAGAGRTRPAVPPVAPGRSVTETGGGAPGRGRPRHPTALLRCPYRGVSRLLLELCGAPGGRHPMSGRWSDVPPRLRSAAGTSAGAAFRAPGGHRRCAPVPLAPTAQRNCHR